jgi:hypothetical protein
MEKETALLKIVIDLFFGNKVNADILRTNWRQIVQIAEENEVQVPIIEKLCGLPQPPGKLLNLCDKARREFTSFWEVTGNIQDVLSEEGIETILIHTLRTYDFYDWDIDLVVHREDLSQAMNVLTCHGWSDRQRVLSDFYKVSSLIERRDRVCLERESSPHHIVKSSLLARSEVSPFIDFYKKLAWRSAAYIPDEVLWSHVATRTFRGHDYRVPSPTLDFLINCAHSVFENYELGLGDIYHLARTLQEERIDMPLAREIAERNHWRKGLELVIETVGNLSNNLGNLEALPYSYGLSRLWPVWLERVKSHLRRPRNWSKGVLELANAFFYMWHRR